MNQESIISERCEEWLKNLTRYMVCLCWQQRIMFSQNYSSYDIKSQLTVTKLQKHCAAVSPLSGNVWCAAFHSDPTAHSLESFTQNTDYHTISYNNAIANVQWNIIFSANCSSLRVLDLGHVELEFWHIHFSRFIRDIGRASLSNSSEWISRHCFHVFFPMFIGYHFSVWLTVCLITENSLENF